MSNLLDEIPEPYKAPLGRRFRKVTEEENFEALNNDEREPVTEDFEDSPFADREPLEDEKEEKDDATP
jgi:hypothetical protein